MSNLWVDVRQAELTPQICDRGETLHKRRADRSLRRMARSSSTQRVERLRYVPARNEPADVTLIVRWNYGGKSVPKLFGISCNWLWKVR